ncbi:SusC/RagA family TonB-linked outer membrane protein [Bacteroides ihuae]|uniref:SusC/RagA family TonB-linked outer membrane protein n=1 Tax=Bacteroides ihuae TaxID=1852362 RepID=UPI0008DAE95C|nr:TonB-dependent receptor [Bacteroides ihuae]
MKNTNHYYSRPLGLFILLCLMPLWAFAQNITVKGVVKDATGESIIGASVIEKGSTNGIITDLDGNFALHVPKNATLVISFVGYKPQEVPVNGNTLLQIVLKDDAKLLEEVVVVGYGTQKKADLSSAIAVLPAKELNKVPGGLQAGLQSSVAGVQVTNGRIKIRGVGSINNTDPLYVVDGMIGGSVPDEANIGSIQILKDAASCAIYGARGANGVIVITTKRGITGEVKVDYDGFAGIKNLSHNIDMLNGQELAELVNEELWNAGKREADDYLKAYKDPASIGQGYDMFNALKRTGFYQKHNLSISGGSENASFRINSLYSSDKPIFIKEDTKNYGMQFISDFTKGKFKFGETVSLKRTNHDWSDKNLLLALKWAPTLPLYDETSSTGYAGAGNGTDLANSLAQAHLNWHKGETTTINGNAWATYEILPGLKYKFNMGVDMYRYMVQDYEADYSIPYQNHSPDSYSMSSYKTNRFLYENTLSYDKTIGKHTLNVLMGVTSEETKGLSVTAGARDMPSEDVLILGTALDDTSKSINSTVTNEAMFSMLGRINYNYDSKYLLTFNFRRDGSSKFSKANRYGNFPSLSVAWRVSQENFMKALPAISDLKLRASWGMLGNSNIKSYQYQSTVAFSGIWYYFNNSKNTGGLDVTPSNLDVKWESQYSTDFGLDLSLFDNQLSFTADYYYKKTSDMLVEIPISYAAGYSDNKPTLNAGSIENKGLEFAATYRKSVGKLDYSVTGNISTVKNEVLSIGSNNEIMASNGISKTAVGRSIGEFWGYVTNGLYRTQEELNADKAFAPNASLGDVRFVDRDKNGVADQDYIGNPIPKFSYGLSADVSYKAACGTFDMAMIWQGSQGNDIYNKTRYFGEGMYHYYNNFASTLDRYRAEELVFVNPISGLTTIYPKNTNTNMPRAVMGDPNQNMRNSDRYVEDGSYLRLKALTIGYTLPRSLTNKLNIDNLRVYIGGKNLLTFTKYNGFDPEVGDQDTTDGTNLTRGVDGSTSWDLTFPNSREYFMGVQLAF